MGELVKVSDLSILHWRKSTYSGTTGGDCVELADLAPVIAVRDSKNPDAPHLAFGRAAFGKVLKEIRSGRHDL
ncbi:DUF397 domain-containing protein [Actinocorallia sp. B10E7]|uniref:DUF397 domain-containing protein n=1 Tax=Actinocorallia sp. B10E7 TaxID=3153558 RepID=UPI00325E6CED